MERIIIGVELSELVYRENNQKGKIAQVTPLANSV